MQEWQQRVVDEHQEVGERLEKLHRFIVDTPQFETLGDAERGRLKLQAFIMSSYREVLRQRIEAWG